MNSFFYVGILSLIAGTLVSGFLYYKKGQTFGATIQKVLFVLRAVGFGALLFVLLAPFLSYKTKVVNKPIVAVLIDNSTSMVSGKDSSAVKQVLSEQIKIQLQNLENAEPQFYYFDEKVNEDNLDFKGKATDLGFALSEVAQKIDKNRLSAIVVASDGIVNRGGNPLYQIEKSFLPVYTIAFGDSTRQVDFKLLNTKSPEFVFRGDEIFIETTFSSENILDANAVVTLKQGNKTIATNNIKVQSINFAKNMRFRINTKEVGLFTYRIEVEPTMGEKNTTNNVVEFVVEVLENRKKIAILYTSPTPDVAAIHESLKSVDAYQTAVVDANKNIVLDAKTELAIVFIQPFASQNVLKNALTKYKGPLWVIIDPKADGSVVQETFQWISKIGLPDAVMAKPQLNEDFGLFRLTKEARNQLNRNQELAVFTGDIRFNGVFETLLQLGNKKPLASYGTIENKRVVVFNFSGIWSWRVRVFKENNTHILVDEWLQTTAQYLTANGSGNRLKLAYDKRLSRGRNQNIKAIVYDASFVPSTMAQVNVVIKDETDKEFEYALQWENERYVTNISGLVPGKYSFTASAKLGEETLRETGTFFVENQTLESLNTRANYLLLSQMSEASGGTFFTQQNFNDLVTELNSNNKIMPIESTKTTSIALIDLKWLFFLIVLIFSVEWLLRRYFGSI